MRTSLERSLGALGAALALVTAASCGGRSTPTPNPAPDSRSSLTSTSDATITTDPKHDPTYTRIEELLQARAPGLQVMRRADGSYALRIRGMGSFDGNNEPLVIIDGMPLQANQVGAELAAINPRDVVRIDVLKDAASTSFYGMRGSNGVIVISTHRK